MKLYDLLEHWGWKYVIRFRIGMNHTRAKTPERRDRLLLLAALAQTLFTVLGAAGERCGIDRYLKANTSKKRTMSLFSQGCYWFQAIDGMKTDRLRMLMTAFGVSAPNSQRVLLATERSQSVRSRR